MAHVLSPFQPVTWASFASAMELFKSHGGHVVIKHTSRTLPLLGGASLESIPVSKNVVEVGCSEEEAEEVSELMTMELGMLSEESVQHINDILLNVGHGFDSASGAGDHVLYG